MQPPMPLHPMHRMLIRRLTRFVMVGGMASIVQLALFTVFEHRGWPDFPADALSLLLSAQVSFALNASITWRDRWVRHRLLRNWLLFHGSIAGTSAVNLLVFMLARPFIPTVLAAALGIFVASIGNFTLGNHVVFRVAPQPVAVEAEQDMR